jgi:hypothetical protein
MMKLVQQVCRAGTQPNTHIRRQLGNTLPYDHIHWTQLPNTSASVSWRKKPPGSHFGKFVFNQIYIYIYVYMMEKNRYTCRLYTRRLLQLRYLHRRKYAGHVYIQYWTAKIFTRSSTETFKKWTKQINEMGNIYGLLSITISECPLLFYLRIEHY